jgi:predicted ArsR family transcriptional regulator
MLELLGERQKQLMRLLLKKKSGVTIEELSDGLAISRNAVRQHLTALERDGLVMSAATKPSGGRPHQLYVLSDQGKEFFARHYAWFAQLLVESLRSESGEVRLKERLRALGASVAAKLLEQHAHLETPLEKVETLAGLMQDLGYESKRATAADGTPMIEADNCVFHTLAMKNPDVCQFDLALLETFTGTKVDHEECMAKAGGVCRFRFTTAATRELAIRARKA